jgi:hypothetical protein
VSERLRERERGRETLRSAILKAEYRSAGEKEKGEKRKID